jgi:hypothetical protein
MDSVAQLALLTKAKLVFETDGTFLSFPALTPLSYSPDELSFSASATSASATAYSDFCRFANALPTGVVFQPALDTLLWDLYQSIFTNAQLAQSGLTPQQTAALQAADAYLYTQASDGTRSPSPQLVAYNQYQQAYLQAQQDYKSQQLTALASTDPTVQSQWQNTTEPQLRAAVQTAETNWEQQGFKAQVEQALTVELNSAALSPTLLWQTWSGLLNSDLDVLTDPASNATFAPTALAPSDILAQTSWPTFTLSSPEIAQLVSQAPAELSSALSTAAGASNIQSLSFEFCSVALVRPWFSPAVFNAHFWRFSDPSMQLSDGGNPPQGQWPAYVTGLVLARNIVEQDVAAATTQPQPVRAFPPIALRASFIPPQPPPRLIPVSPVRPIIVDPVIAQQNRQLAINRLSASTFTARPMARPTLQAASVVRPQQVVARPASSFLLHNTAAVGIGPGRFTAVGLPTPTPAPAPAAAAPPPPAPTTNPGISILAFICKPLPKCPDPDPSLTW